VVDIESMIKFLRVLFGDNSDVWKNYVEYLLKETGGPVPFNCNYNVQNLNYQFSILPGVIEMVY